MTSLASKSITRFASATLLAIFPWLSCCAQAAPAPAQQAVAAAAPVEKGPLLRARKVTETMLAAKGGRQYRILLSVPQGATPDGGFPVLYVLDADAWFGTAVEIAKMREYEKLAPAVIVGVASPKHFFFDLSRSYDFTPAGSDPDFEGIKTGGADAFLAFLNDTLKPWVSAKCRVDPARQILFGHSLGGTFALHVLFNAPRSFNIYLIASPHIYYADKAALKNEASFEGGEDRHKVRVLLTDGSLENHSSPELVDDYRRYYTAHPETHPGQSVDEAIADLFADRPDDDKIGQTRALAERLSHSGVKASFVEFDGEEHMSAAVSALNRGVPFALRPAR